MTPPVGMRGRLASWLLACLVLLSSGPSAPAQGLTDPTPVSGWIVTLRANAGFAPDYEGARNLSPYLLPGLGMRRPDSPVAFGSPDEAPGFALLDQGWFKAGLSGRVRGPRQQQRYGELHGIHDIDWTLEAGGFAEFWTFEKLRARVELRHGFLGHHGNVAEIYLDWVERHGPWTVSFGPRFSLADKPYMNKFFGVTTYEALLNGNVSPFEPAGGAKSVGATAAVSYEWSQAWTTTLYGRYNRLIGEAAAGPIVERLGSRNQFTIGLSAAYSFHWDGF